VIAVEVAGEPGAAQAAALLSRNGTVFAMLTVTAFAEGIDQILWMMNPAKITAMSVSD
jgi:hypothetical protein